MKVEYTRRAVADLRKVSAESLVFGDSTAAKVEARIREVVARIVEHPQSAASVAGRPNIHVALLVHYPYKIFYRVIEGGIRILHVRHTARRPWTPKR